MTTTQKILSVLGAATVLAALTLNVDVQFGSTAYAQQGAPAGASGPAAATPPANNPPAPPPQCTNADECSMGEDCDTVAGKCVDYDDASRDLGDDCKKDAQCTTALWCGVKSHRCVASDKADDLEAKKAADKKAADKRQTAEDKADDLEQAVEDAQTQVTAAKDALAQNVAECAADSTKCDPAKRTALGMSVQDAEGILAAAKLAAAPPVKKAAVCDPSKSEVCAFQVQAKRDGHYTGGLDGQVGPGTCAAVVNYSGVATEVIEACEDYNSAHPAPEPSAAHGTTSLAAPPAADPSAALTGGAAVPSAWAPFIEAQRAQGEAIQGLQGQVRHINGRLDSFQAWKLVIEAERSGSVPRS